MHAVVVGFAALGCRSAAEFRHGCISGHSVIVRLSQTVDKPILLSLFFSFCSFSSIPAWWAQVVQRHPALGKKPWPNPPPPPRKQGAKEYLPVRGVSASKRRSTKEFCFDSPFSSKHTESSSESVFDLNILRVWLQQLPSLPPDYNVTSGWCFRTYLTAVR